MTFYTRVQLLEIVGIEERLLVELEQERIVLRDAPEPGSGEYSERMLERARVAVNLVEELEVNLPGVAIILGMRERISRERHTIDTFLVELQRGHD